MTPNLRLVLAVALGGCYLFILCLGTLGAALSYMSRTHGQRFPLWRCVGAAAIPSALPMTVPLALAWCGLPKGSVDVVFALLLFVPFWASGVVERHLTWPLHAARSPGEDHSA